MNFDHAFIITYGRSGSTLLQGILNTIPGAEIRGENANLLFFIYKISEGLQICKRQKAAATDSTHPWFGADRIPFDTYHRDTLDLFKRDVMAPREGRSLIGFKEIRFQIPYPQLAGYIDYLRANFSRTAIIFNTRAMDAVIESNRKAKHFVVEDKVREADANFRRLAEERPDHCYRVHYDDYTADPEHLRGLFDFLGAPFDLDKIRETMARTHSVRTSATATN